MGCISTDGNSECIFGENGIQISGDLLTTPIVATISQSCISTTNPNGFNILSPLNMNSNNIDNVSTINGNVGSIMSINSTDGLGISSSDAGISISTGSCGYGTISIGSAGAVSITSGDGNDITIGSTNQITLNSSDNINVNPSVNLIVNASDSISINATNDINMNNDQYTNITTGKLITLTSQNDNIYLTAPTGKTYINKSGVGDGEIVASNFVGNLSGNANTASTASLATQITTTIHLRMLLII